MRNFEESLIGSKETWSAYFDQHLRSLNLKIVLNMAYLKKLKRIFYISSNGHNQFHNANFLQEEFVI